ncbi:MAG: ATP-dependent sacrificial sulfur transferase LarE [Eubacteriales bacterium]
MTVLEFFNLHPQVAIACSGGVDSALLVHLAGQYAQKVTAYFVNAEFQPGFELVDAQAVCAQAGVSLRVLDVSLLSNETVANNPTNRCYHCKNLIFDAILAAAQADGYITLLDGSNLDDDPADRPGMQALAEKSVLSPLRLCGLDKQAVRQMAKERGLSVWDKPAYACLATRLPQNQPITAEMLYKIDFSEEYLKTLGIFDHRVRVNQNRATIQVPVSQMEIISNHRAEILEKLSPFFQQITLDLGGR